MSKINVGVIGVGQMGTYHAQIYQKLPQVELCALCEFNDSRRKELEYRTSGQSASGGCGAGSAGR